MATQRDPFLGISGVSTPADHCYAVTPSDDDPIPIKPKYLLVLATGDVEVEDADGNSITFVAVAAGARIDFRAFKVTTGTSATVAACW